MVIDYIRFMAGGFLQRKIDADEDKPIDIDLDER